jgi:hypothetical protein
MKSLLFTGFLLSASAVFAGEQQPILTKTGKLLLSESFDAPAIPKNWVPGGHPNSFSIVDGALQGVCAPDDNHGPAISVPVSAHDITVSFREKSANDAYFLFLIDGESQFGGSAHLLRVAIPAGQAQVAQDRGTPASHIEQGKQRAELLKAGQKVPPPTKEQLADPKFYRTEMLAHEAGKFDDGQWHQVLVEVSGNKFAVQVDGLPALRGEGTVFDVQKSKLVFLVGHAGTVLIDDVKAWENEPAAH